MHSLSGSKLVFGELLQFTSLTIGMTSNPELLMVIPTVRKVIDFKSRKMTCNIILNDTLRELSCEELISFNGGAPTKKTSFFYDLVYGVSYLIGKSEIFTAKFWVEWDEAIS